MMKIQFLLSIFQILQMENRVKTPRKSQSCKRIVQPKFKPLKVECNELQSKYDIYKNGSPNIYEQDLSALKAYHIKNDIKTLELPAIEYILKQIKNVPSNTGTNHRDYTIHPSMIQKYGNKFKNMISDQQEIRDFMTWMTKKQKEIQRKQCNVSQKFYLNQSLFASGFNQIITQIASISKPRSQIMRMLWNKQNHQIEQIINLLHKQNTSCQKKNLQSVKTLHIGYQQQIIQLKNGNYCLQKKLEQATVLNESCLNSLRVMRKQIKKYQKIIKQLNQSANTLREQSMELLEENTRLQMKDKNITTEQARMLSYRTMQISKMKRSLNQIKGKGVKHLFKQIRNKAQHIVENNDLHDFQEKKDRLIALIKTRINENTNDKLYILKGQFSDQQDQNIELQTKVQEIFASKQLKSYIFEKFPKHICLFQEQGVNTSVQNSTQNIKKNVSKNIGVQANEYPINEKQVITKMFHPKKNNEQQEIEDIMKLKNKKVQQRHSLMLIQMTKMMEFKKIDNASKIRKLSKINSNARLSDHRNSSCRQSHQQSYSDMSDDSHILQQLQDQIMYKKSKQNIQVKAREKILIKNHHSSIVIPKSHQFQSMISKIRRDSVHSNSNLQRKSKEKMSLFAEQTQANDNKKSDDLINQLTQFKQVISSYIKNKVVTKSSSANPQKLLKKLLTETFRNLYTSGRRNFLAEIIRTGKNIYGNIMYESKLVNLIAMMIQNKDKSLLSASTLLMAIKGSQPTYESINSQDLNEIYFKIYFYLSIKSPTESQFNIWGNYTNISKLNSPGFMSILSEYFNQSKCMYLQLKIRQFIGISPNQLIDGNYYVQLNPLMMYIMEVYLLEKKNYYQSYHQLIQFLGQVQSITLDTFVFLMDLLCVKEEQQKQVIKTWFNNQGQTFGQCPKDVFYRVCIKYELPLFQFLKLLKIQQFKKLPEHIQNDFIDITDTQKWNKVQQSLDRRLLAKNKLTPILKYITEKLDSYIKGTHKVQNQSFLFLYRILVEAAFL